MRSVLTATVIRPILSICLALGSCSASIAIDSNNKTPSAQAVLYIESGDRLLQKELVEQALVAYQKAVQLEPNCSEAHQRLGNALIASGKYEDAVQEVRKAIELNPKNGLAHTNLGWLLGIQRHYRAAIAEEKIAISLDSQNAAAFGTMGLALAGLEQYPEAISAFQKSIQIEPNNIRTYVNLAATFARQGNYPESIKFYRKAISIDNNYLHAHIGLAAALDKTGDLEGAIRELSVAVKLAPNNPSTHGKLGWALYRNGNWNRSLRESVTANMLRVQSSKDQFLGTLITVWAGVFIVFGLIFAIVFSGSRFKPQLEEEVIRSFFLIFHKDKPGRLLITNRRIVFIPEAFSQWFGATRLSIEREQIEQIKPDSTTSGGTVSILSRDGSVSQFSMPNLVLEPMVHELNKIATNASILPQDLNEDIASTNANVEKKDDL